MRKIPLTRPLLPPVERFLPGLKKVFASGIVTNGTYVRRFEQGVADYCGVREAVAVSSCTSGLILSLRCLEVKGAAVLPSYTFFATAHACLWNNLRPVFADISSDFWTLDPAQVEKAVNFARRHSPFEISVLIGVHTHGNPCTPEALERIAKKHKLKLIFDSAHGMGALHHGKPVGRFGDAEVFSLSPTKLLTSGEGGMVTTDDRVLAKRLRAARDYGNAGDYDPEFAGLNARMSELQALLGLESLRALERHARRRQALVTLYKEELGRLPGIVFQKVAPEDRCSYKDFNVLIDPKSFGATRDEVQIRLGVKGFASRRYYFPPVHRIKAYRTWRKISLPVTDRVSNTVLSLPLFYDMAERDVLAICRLIRDIHG
jgi:dTDP-4-amino-4,6-dideoxygalactose transaminase